MVVLLFPEPSSLSVNHKTVPGITEIHISVVRRGGAISALMMSQAQDMCQGGQIGSLGLSGQCDVPSVGGLLGRRSGDLTGKMKTVQ